MALTQCPFGHFYDSERTSECPMCRKNETPGTQGFDMQSQVTVSGYRLGSSANGNGMTELLGDDMIPDGMEELISSSYDAMSDENSTIGYFAMAGMDQYTVGWLVETEGNHKGRSYTLFMGRNRCGSGPDNDVCLDDHAVSSDRHCSVIYERKQNKFFLSPECGAVFFNTDYLDKPVELQSGDLIHIGKTELMFIPFCTSDRSW